MLEKLAYITRVAGMSIVGAGLAPVVVVPAYTYAKKFFTGPYPEDATFITADELLLSFVSSVVLGALVGGLSSHYYSRMHRD